MKQTIIDSHVHFWDPHQLHYDWLAEVPAINRPFLPPDLTTQAGQVQLEGLVFVQADCRPEQGLAEVEWVTELAKTEPRIQAIVAFAPLEQGETVRTHLQTLAQNPLVKGVRRLIQSEGPGFSSQPDFVRGVQLLPEFNLSFDICLKHHQLGEVLQLVEQAPEVSFVLDHCGKPNIKMDLLDPWREHLQRLAAFPNVHGKISGLVTEADWQNWTGQQLRPYIDHVVACFGPERVMYGGDWPVSLLATTYQTWIETLTEATSGLSAEDQHRLFYQNAHQFYRMRD
jgi:L-fuconolactonase